MESGQRGGKHKPNIDVKINKPSVYVNFQCFLFQVPSKCFKICLLQVLRQESSPHKYLTVATGDPTWGIRSSVDSASSVIHSASAGTACPSSPSESVSERYGWNSWRFYDGSGWHNGEIEVSCSNCDDIVLHAQNVDSLRSSQQSLLPSGIRLNHAVT